MIDLAYSIVLLLNMTGLFRILALPFGSTGLISAGMLVLNFGYLVYRYPVVKRLIRQASILEWSAVILFWPVLALFMLTLGGDAGSSAMRAFLVHFYLLTLMLGAATYVAVRGWRKFRRLAVVAAGVTVIGSTLNALNPALFYRIGAQVADSFGKVDVATAGASQLTDLRRAAGFFIEPNLTALSCNVLMVALLAPYERTSLRAKLVIMGVMLMLVAGSGSRGGMLVNVLLSGYFLWNAREQLRESTRLTRGVAIAAAVSLAILIGLGWVVGLSVAGDRLESRGLDGLASRLQFWTDLGEGGERDLFEDESLKARLEAQALYVEFISERPFLGHGPDGTRLMYDLGRTDKMSHNLFFEKAFRYGLPYLALMLWVFFQTYRRGQRWRSRLPDNASVTTALVLLLGSAGMIAGGVIDARAVIVVVGAILGYQYRLRRRLTAAQPGPATATAAPSALVSVALGYPAGDPPERPAGARR